jgi:hypothetical protein
MHVEFRCPHCGAQASAPDSGTGPTGVCSSCGKPLTVSPPGSFDDDALHAKRTVWPVIAMAVFLSLLLLLLLPAMKTSPPGGRLDQCMSNLMQISKAMLMYEADHGSLPPAYVADKNGRPMHSWRVLLLPYLDRLPLYKEYHFDEPWDGPHNRPLADRMPRVYRCPSAPTGVSVTSYAVVVGPNTVFPGATAVRRDEISDGLSNTILVVEAARVGINWLEPRDLKEENMHFKINGDPRTEISSFHVHLANAMFCDASPHPLKDSIDPALLKDLIERNDGHRVDMDQLR